MATIYEWIVETVDEDGDIHDVRHWDTFTEAKADYDNTAFLAPGESHRMGLVRDKRDRNDDLDRSWAYLTVDGALPLEFRDAYDRVVTHVPRRFLEAANGRGSVR